MYELESIHLRTNVKTVYGPFKSIQEMEEVYDALKGSKNYDLNILLLDGANRILWTFNK